MSATSDNISPQRSPITPRSSNGHHRPEGYTTRSLSLAIDALRRECEAVLWEFNSLKTQNSTLEQRILDQAGELDDINRSLRTLREQHALIEGQYRDKLKALRSELRALQEEQSSTVASMSAREPRQSPSPPDWPHIASDQRVSQRHRSHSVSVNTLFTPVPVVPPGLRAHTRNLGRDRSTDDTRTSSSYIHAAHSPRPPYTPPPLRDATSHTTSSQSQYTPRSQPRVRSGLRGTNQSYIPSPPDPSVNPPSHDPSLSPTATLVGSDAPSRPRSRKG